MTDDQSEISRIEKANEKRAPYIILKPTDDTASHEHKEYEIFKRVDGFTAAVRQRELAIMRMYGSGDPDDVMILKEVDWRTEEKY